VVRRSANGGSSGLAAGYCRPAPRSGASSHCAARTGTGMMRGGRVHTRTFPRHARRLGVAQWAGRMAELRGLRPRADREAGQPPARYDPLIHPVAITERCVIGDQIRVPSARCEMAGCASAFADPAALGEADNRARALVAGWDDDPLGQLVCPACQRRCRVAPARWVRQWEPDTACDRTTADAAAGLGGGVRQSVPSTVAGWHRGVSRGQNGRSKWPHLLAALASEGNGWTAPQRVAVPDAGKVPDEATDPAVRRGAPRHTGRHRSAPRWYHQPGNVGITTAARSSNGGFTGRHR